MKRPSATVLIPLPNRDFDPSEAAVSWQILTTAGHKVVFATPDGRPAHADPLILSGEELDLWGFVPGLKKLKLLGLMLPGGHRWRGMRTYLENTTLQQVAAGFFDANKPVAAVWHGVVLAARSISARTGKSVLHGRKTSGLFRDSAEDNRSAFVVSDGNYISSRWPGDVHAFASTFTVVLRS